MRIIIAIFAVAASFMMAESLMCNTCSYGIGTFCLSSSVETCPANQTACFNGTLRFTAVSALGFKSQGCREAAGCNATTTGTLLGLEYTSEVACCSTDRCANAAPSTKTTLTAVIGVAVLASMWSSIM